MNVDYAVEQDTTVLNWLCHICEREATAVGIVIKDITIQTKGGFSVGEGIGQGFVKPWREIIGNVEFVPCCAEHDSIVRTHIVLKAPLTEEIKRKIKLDNIEAGRDITI